MQFPVPSILSKTSALHRLLVAVLLLGVTVAPAWGSAPEDSHVCPPQEQAGCCGEDAGDQPQPGQEKGNCCGSDCHRCHRTGGAVLLMVPSPMANVAEAVAVAPIAVEASSLPLGNTDPIFHPPRL